MTSRSSFHFLSGDQQLSSAGRFIYRQSYYLERCIAALRHGSTPIEIYQPALDRAAYVAAFGEAALDVSASRVLCFDFIASHGKSIFGPERGVIDLGCGHGGYAGHFKKAFGYKQYAGYDISKRSSWDDLTADDTHFRVKELGAGTIDVSGFDTVFSQSVLEHVAHDVAVLHKFTARRPTRLQHLHLIPALETFRIYKFHGYRRYSPYQIDRLLAAPGIRNPRVFAFGNGLTRDLHLDHYEYLARPRTDFRARRGPYDHTMPMFDNLHAHRAAIHPPRPEDADFYALTFEQDVG